MSPKTALVIGAIAAFASGLPLAVAPATMLAAAGISAPSETLAIARGAGATLIGVGTLNWMLRNATGEPLRGVLAGNLVIQALSLIVNASAVLSGQLPVQAASASVVHAILGTIFVLAIHSVSAVSR